MSTRRTLRVGDSTVFITRPIGLTTRLFVIPWPPDPGARFPTISWHIELCCQPDHIGSRIEYDISEARGALVTVRVLAADAQAQVWTDYA